MESSHIVCNRDSLIIAGSGNVAWNVYKIANLLDYKISIIDNQAKTLTSERFPEASELILGDIVEQLSQYDINEAASIVLVTYHHEFDESALQAVITSPARYIGVLGDRRKAASYYNRLNEMGISEALMNRVHMPIGLDIGGEKPTEIALSVMAEIQAVKYQRPGGFTVIKSAQGERGKRGEYY